MSEKRFLTAKEILDVNDLLTVDVEMPEWGGGFVRLRSLSGEEAASFMEAFQKDKDSAAVRLLVLCAVNPDGTQVFTNDQIEKLKKKSLRAIMRLQREALKLNGLSDQDTAKAKND